MMTVLTKSEKGLEHVMRSWTKMIGWIVWVLTLKWEQRLSLLLN